MQNTLIYLDHNAMVDVMNNRRPMFSTSVRKAQFSGAKFIYSPAHIEEIANILRHEKLSDQECDRHTNNHIAFISEFTGNWEFLPNHEGGPTRLVQEHPGECYRRVIDKYELTYRSENTEEFLRCLVKESVAKDTPIDAFTQKEVREIFQKRLFFRGLGESFAKGVELRNSYKTIESLVDICFRSLADAGFGLETKQKTRSAIHDVTHAIYGFAADIFITGDRKALGKTKATYEVLGAECVAMSTDEFIARLSTDDGGKSD